MVDILERVVTITALREAIRAKIRAGVSRETITKLIQVYAPPDAPSRDDGTGLRRVAVEYVPRAERPALLRAIGDL